MASVTCPKCNEKTKLPTKKCSSCGFIFKFQEIDNTPEEEEIEIIEVEEEEEVEEPIIIEEKKERVRIERKVTPEEIIQAKRMITATIIALIIYLGVYVLPNHTITSILNSINLYRIFGDLTDFLRAILFVPTILIGILSICNKRGLRLAAIIVTLINIAIQIAIMAVLLFTTLSSGFNNLVILLALIAWTGIQIMSLGKKETKKEGK